MGLVAINYLEFSVAIMTKPPSTVTLPIFGISNSSLTSSGTFCTAAGFLPSSSIKSPAALHRERTGDEGL